MTEITLEGAKAIAEATLKGLSGDYPMEVQLLHDDVLATSNGWVFFYESSEYIRTGQFDLQLVGNAPIYVRRDGYASLLPTHSLIEQSIREADEAYSPLPRS